MPIFVNDAAFNDPKSRMLAQGVDLNPNHAIVDPKGNVLAYARTGGMLAPQRHELRDGAKIYRFGGSGRTPQQIVTGAWWIEQAEFEKLLSFGQTHGLAVAMAMRLLCLVPPEWSDATLLVRARVVRPLLAWRGLGDSVVTPARVGGGMVRMPQQNEIAARRLHQLCVPGLNQPGMADNAVSLEASYPLDAREAVRGFIYL